MIAHFIHFEGKGFWILLLPLLNAFIFFTLFGEMQFDDKFVLPVDLMFSAAILWFVDGGPDLLNYTREARKLKSKNTLMWIEMKYWAIVMLVAGTAYLFYLL